MNIEEIEILFEEIKLLYGDRTNWTKTNHDKKRASVIDLLNLLYPNYRKNIITVFDEQCDSKL